MAIVVWSLSGVAFLFAHWYNLLFLNCPLSNLLRKLTNELRKTRNCRSAKVYFQYRHLYHSRTRSKLFKR